MKRSLSWHNAIIKSLIDDWTTKSTEDSYLKTFYTNYNFLDGYSSLDLDLTHAKSSHGEEIGSRATSNTRPDNAGARKSGEDPLVTINDNDDNESAISQTLSSNDSLVNVNLYRFHYRTLSRKQVRTKPTPKPKTRRNNKRTSYANVVFKLS